MKEQSWGCIVHPTVTSTAALWALTSGSSRERGSPTKLCV